MNIFDENLVELKAVCCVNLELIKSKCIKPEIATNDKTPSWDGHLYIYHEEKNFSKKNLIGRIPLQVKGTYVERINMKTELKHSVDIIDIRNYYNDGKPICYFVVEVSENEYCCYFNIWTNDDLKRIKDNCGNKKSITLKFNIMNDTNEFVKQLKIYFNDNKKIVTDYRSDSSLRYDKKVMPSYSHNYYINGLDNVRIDAFIPAEYNEELCCLIYINGHDSISYGEKDLKSIFFSEHNKENKKRSFILHYNNKYLLTLPNLKYEVDEKIVNDLCILLDDLYDEYIKYISDIQKILGTYKFKECEKGIKILNVSKSLWDKMVCFTYKHDFMDKSDVKWNIFNPVNGNKMIQICNNINSGIKADLFAIIYADFIEHDTVDLYWEPGYSPSINKMDGFDNKKKWAADYTHDWILNSWIPYIKSSYDLCNGVTRNWIFNIIRNRKNIIEFEEKVSCEYRLVSYKLENI